jgi:HSP20 family protein
MERKRSLWERLTGSVSVEEDEENLKKEGVVTYRGNGKEKRPNNNWIEEENEEAELAVDIYQTGAEIVVQTFVAGVKPEDLELSIARDMITIIGHREEHRNIDEDNYFTKELYWGKFSRTLTLPQEVEPEEVEATERHGLLTIRLQKVDKNKTNTVKIKSI